MSPGARSAGLEGWIVEQRWFAAKSREPSGLEVLETLRLGEAPGGPVDLVLVEVRFATGAHERYQLLLGEGGAVADVVGDRAHGATLARLFDESATVTSAHGSVAFHRVAGAPAIGTDPEVRPMGAEQSNSSVVLGDGHALKVFRRLEAGDNPELEMLRFLTAADFRSIARLEGWYAYAGTPMDATLGVLQEYVAGATDGWELVLAAIGAGDASVVERLRELGGVTGAMHRALGSAPADPVFAPEEPGPDALGLLRATIDEQIENLWPELPSERPELASLLHRGQELRDRLQALGQVPAGGREIRHHGDFHLGQALSRPDGRWVILDFEGEPARPLLERRRKRSPLRDVAGMLRSLAYAASASELLHGRPAPAGWEQRARAAFLDGYHEHVDPGLLPPGRAAVDRLLAVFELEKAVYELRYELDNRPDWVQIPAAGLLRLLEEPLP